MAAFAAAAGLQRLRPLPRGTGSSGWQMAGVVLIGLGAGLICWAMICFARARTAIIPRSPASMLVLGGPYTRTRNPMYIGFVAAYLGGTMLLGGVWPLLLLLLVILILTRTVIQREERYLGGAFGAEYEQYRKTVRRWI